MASAVFMLSLSTGLLAMYRWKSQRDQFGDIVVYSALFAVFGSCFSITLAFQALLTLVPAIGCWKYVFTRKYFFTYAVVSMCVAYFGLVVVRIPVWKAWQAARSEYPIVSLASRLSYEDGRPSARTIDSATTVDGLSQVSQQGIEKIEGKGAYSYRAMVLQRMHERSSDLFVLAEGFGPSRMSGMSWPRINLDEPPPIPMPPSPRELSAGERRLVPPAATQLPSESQLLDLHQHGFLDFVRRDRMGYVVDREHVSGFQPHQFSEVPHFEPKSTTALTWNVVRLELISLLKHDPPAVYVSEFLPRMDELADAATRPLDAFEQSSLSKLRLDEDMVIHDTPVEIRMVGGLRASKQCLQCHQAQRGELLGALLYVLRPSIPAPPAPPAEGPQTRLQWSGVERYAAARNE